MLFSENKLRELASLDKRITTNEILYAINSIGFEVESCNKFSNIHGIKFGFVLKTYKNEESDKLNVCEIKFEDKIRIIQTTASNVKVGDYLIAFVPGSGINGVTFEAKKMKGIVSEGMLTSLEEIGFDKKNCRKEWANDIFIFDKISLEKDPIVELGLDDNIIDISILTNRSDANSYIVMSWELSAYFQTIPYISTFKNETKKSSLKTKPFKNNSIFCIESSVDSININLSDWILLLKTNIKLENNAIDLSSLSLIMTGVSSRIYDQKKISGEITLAKKSIFLFNDVEVIDSLIVTNGENILSIAGVIESNKYKYNANTKNIMFEFSSLDPKEVRIAARNLKISNQSSINCSKIISRGSIILALNFMSTKLEHFSNSIGKVNLEKKEIKFDKDYLNKYAGFNIVESKKYINCIKSLEILGFEINNIKIIIPLYRHDIETMQDMVEEIFRFYGLNNFNATQPTSKFNKISNFRDFAFMCSMMGYVQFWSYTLINNKKNTFNPFLFKNKISLLTFISEEHNSIRNSMALVLDEYFSYNSKRKMNNINAFDIGMINNKKALCLASDTKTYSEMVEDVFKIYGTNLKIKKLNLEFLHPNYNAGLFYNNNQVGWIGKIHPQFTKNNVIFGEIIIDDISIKSNKFIEYANFPLKERDITISLKENESINEFMTNIKKINGIYEIKKIASFIKGDLTNITFKVKLDDLALIEFDNKFNI